MTPTSCPKPHAVRHRIGGADEIVLGDRSPVELSDRLKADTVCPHLGTGDGRLVAQSMIPKAIWVPDHRKDRQDLRACIRQLRAKIGDDASSPRGIITEAGEGSRFLRPRTADDPASPRPHPQI